MMMSPATMALRRRRGFRANDFPRVVELYRHGIERGTNFLYMDGHVGHALPQDALTGIDPWDLNTPIPETP